MNDSIKMIQSPVLLSIFLLSLLKNQGITSFNPANGGISTCRSRINTITTNVVHEPYHQRNSRPSSATIILHQSSSSSSSSDYNQYKSLQRKGITLPLLDLSSQKPSDTIITPLPACHLPPELSSQHIYGMQLQVAIHKMMIEETLSKVQGIRAGSGMDLQQDMFARDTTSEPLYGHLISSSSAATATATASSNSADDVNSLIGKIGCAAEIIIASPSDMDSMGVVRFDTIIDDPPTPPSLSSDTASYFDDDDDDDNESLLDNNQDSAMTVLTKGSFRFIVREVIQTFPYPIVVVDELLDEPPSDDNNSVTSTSSNTDDNRKKELLYNDFEDSYEDKDDEDFEEEEEEEDDEDIYADLSSSELLQRTLAAMKAIVDQKLDIKTKPISPLEQSILEQKGLSNDLPRIESIQRDQAEEMAATLDVFISSLIDIAPSKTERFYAVAMMAAEFGGLDNGLRKDILITTNGVERLRMVVKALEKKISFVQAQKLTQDIVDKSDEDSKDLKVGKPSIPEWAKRFSAGMKIEYYWSEQDGWLGGTIKDAVMIVDEMIVTVLFDDGETVRLPFDPEEKARWRPAGM